MKVYLYVLKFVAPYGVRVGSSEKGGSDLYPLMVNNAPVIPESSWKGAFRRVSEQVCGSEVKVDGELLKKLGENLGKEVQSIKDYELLYGLESMAGRISFSASVLEEAKLITKPHASMDRARGKVAEQHLFFEHLAFPKNEITVNVIVRGDEALECWEKTLRFVQVHGLMMGAGKTRGNGYLVLKEVKRAVVNEVSEKPKFS